MRIAVVGACPYPVAQGSQVYLRETARALQRAGHDVRLVVYPYGDGEDDDSDLPIHRARSIVRSRKTGAGPSFAKPFLDAAMVRTLRKVCRDHRIEAVSAHNYEGLLVALAARKRPIVYHSHNAMADELPFYFNGSKRAARFGAWLDRTFPKRADSVVVPHERLKAYLVQCGCPEEHVHVVPPPIDPIADAPGPGMHTDLLYTGNLDAYQNLELLRDAMNIIDSQRPGVRLRVVSGQPLEGTPLEGMSCVDYVYGADRETLKRELLRGGIFVCPRTSWSGFPIKLLNAMAAGLPIVCCESSAHPITHEETGLVVPDDDAEAFAKACRRLFDDVTLAEQLSANARDHCRLATGESASVIMSAYEF